jgi:hypothetical protein
MTKSSGGILGGGITSDANGTISLRLYYNVDLSGTTDLTQAALNSLLSAGVHAVSIQSSDGLSRASTTISIPQYVQEEIRNYGLVPTAPEPTVTLGPITATETETNVYGPTTTAGGTTTGGGYDELHYGGGGVFEHENNVREH